MSDLLQLTTDPTSWFIASAVVGTWMGYLVCRFSVSEFERNGYEPRIDYDALQAELDEEFAPVRVRASK